MNKAIRRMTTAAIAAAVVAAITWPPAVGLASAQVAAGGSADAKVASVSCPSAGNCAAVGYLNAAGVSAFVVNEVHGTWGRAQPVKGMAALPKGGPTVAYLAWVSCSSPGNCGAGGNYVDHSRAWHSFVVTQANGTWGRAKEVILPTPHSGGYSEIDSVSCQAPGDCTAIGSYTSKSHSLLFVVTEQGGTWGKAQQVPGMGSLKAIDGYFDTLSCPSAGNCGAGGTYVNARGTNQAFVVTQTHGRWGNMREVPGTGAVNKSGSGHTESVSCPAAGSCLAVGYYDDSHGSFEPFISAQKNGVWGHIQPVPGLAKLTTDPGPTVEWAWCASPGNCTAIGPYYTTESFHAFYITEKNGRWDNAKKIPLGARQVIAIASVACVSIGDCSAGGWFQGTNSQEAFVISQTNGTWGKAEEVPGSVRLNHGGYAYLFSVSCGAPGDCTAGGYYSPKWPQQEPFLVTQDNGVWGNMIKVRGLP